MIAKDVVAQAADNKCLVAVTVVVATATSRATLRRRSWRNVTWGWLRFAVWRFGALDESIWQLSELTIGK